MLTQQDIQLFQQILDQTLNIALKGFATKEDLKDFARKEDLERFATKEDLKEFATKKDLEEMRKEMVTKKDFEMKIEQIRTEMVTHADLQNAVDEIIDYTKTCFKTSEEQLTDHEKRLVKLENQKGVLVSQ